MSNRITLFLLFICLTTTANATTFYLKINCTLDWNDACNWYTDPDDITGSDCQGVPGFFDDVVINGHSFVNIQHNTTINSLSYAGFGTIGGDFEFTILNNATIYGSCGISTGRTNILGSLYFRGGSIGGTDTAFVHGPTYFIANAGISKPLVMLGGGEWQDYHINLSTSDGFLINSPGAIFQIHNDLRNVACNYDSGGEFKNYGTVIKDSPYNVTFNSPASMTGGEMYLVNATTTFMNNFPNTDSELTVYDGATLDFNNGSRPFVNSTLNSEGYVKMKGSNVFNVGCTATFDTLHIYGSGGATFYISPSVANLRMLGGAAYFYEDFSISSSFWWTNGHLYGDARITCYPEAQLVEDGGSASYTSCIFDFLGGARWTSGGYVLNSGSQFNIPAGEVFHIEFNSALSIVTGSGTPYGTINLEGDLHKLGSGVAILDVVFNSDSSDVIVYGGGLDLWRGTHRYSYFWINTALFLQLTQAGNNFYYCEITGLGTVRETDFNSKIDSASTLDCHLEITGGTLTVNSDITPLSLKITTGTLNGSGDMVVVGTFTWSGTGHINGSGTITVNGFTTISSSGYRGMYKQIILEGGGSWTGSVDMSFTTTGILRIPEGRTLTLSPTAVIDNMGTQSAVCGIIVEGQLIKTTTFEFDMQGADLTNNGSIEGIGTFRTSNGTFVHPNTGILSPGHSGMTGAMVWSGHFENKTNGNLVFDFQENEGGILNDSLRLLNNVVFGGTLTVNADPCWPAFERTIISWAGTRTGSFANIILPDNYTIVIDDMAKNVKVVHTQSGVVISCPEDIMTTTDPGLCTATVYLGLTDNDNATCYPTLNITNDAPENYSIGITTVTWSATETGGLSGTCTQNVIVTSGALEVCNATDDDCDGLVDDADPDVAGQNTYYQDSDADTYGSGAVQACDQGEYANNNDDCDDSDPDIHPGAQEFCNNGIDDDCDNLADDDDDSVLALDWYQDFDGDGHGNPEVVLLACLQPVGYVSDSLDCNDNSTVSSCDNPTFPVNSDITDISATLSWTASPGAQRYNLEIKRTTDASYGPSIKVYTNTYSATGLIPGTKYNWRVRAVCDSLCSINSGLLPGQSFRTNYQAYPDADSDGYGDITMPYVLIPAFPAAGYVLNNLDCNDIDNDVYPGATEVCNGIDEDCDVVIDEETTPITWYEDFDSDGLGNPDVSLTQCPAPEGYVINSLDCNDNNSSPECTLPSDISVSTTTTTATINWTSSPCVSYYSLQYKLIPGGTWSPQLTVYGNSSLLTGLTMNATYQYRIRSRCNAISTSTIWVTGTFTTTGAMNLAEINVPDVELNTDFTVYPNPGTGIFNIKIESQTETEAMMILTDELGKVVLTNKWSLFEGQNSWQLDLMNLASGVYQVQILQGDLLMTNKVVLMK